jgi:hypothetical protein
MAGAEVMPTVKSDAATTATVARIFLIFFKTNTPNRF